jgi:hypothetical protein
MNGFSSSSDICLMVVSREKRAGGWKRSKFGIGKELRGDCDLT